MSDPSLEFDRFLDRLVDPDVNHRPHDPLERSASWFHRSAPQPAPDPVFARSLRAQLLNGSAADEHEPVALPLTTQSTPVGAIPQRRLWVYVEVAALFLLMAPALWFVTRVSSPAGPASVGSVDESSRLLAAATSPTATTPPSRSMVTILPIETEESGAGTQAPTVTPIVEFAREASFSAGSLLSVVFEVPMRDEPKASAAVVKPLPAGTLLYATADAQFSPEGSGWIPVVEAQSGAEGWVPIAWVQTPIIEGRIVSRGGLVETAEPTELYSVASTSGNVVVSLNAGQRLIAILSTTIAGGRDWVQVIDPTTKSVGWVLGSTVDVTSELGPASPIANDTSELPAIDRGKILTARIDTALHLGPSETSDILAPLSAGEILLVTGAEFPADGLWVPVITMSPSQPGWVGRSHLEPVLIDGQPVVNASPATVVTSSPLLREPALDDEVMSTLEPGRTVIIVADPVFTSGRTWWRVLDPASRASGWVLGTDLLNVPEVSFAASPSPAATPIATATPLAIHADSGESEISVAANVPAVMDSLVVLVGASELTVREAPAQDSRVVTSVPLGSRLEILGGPIEVDSHIWINVLVPAMDSTGWIDAGMASSRPYLMPISIETRLNLYLRSSPSRDGEVIRRLTNGASFRPFGSSVISDGVTWVPVLDQRTGKIAWLGAVLGSPLDWPVGTAMKTSVPELKLRSAPSLEAEILMSFEQGTALTLVSRPVEHGGEGWLHVRAGSGQEGWILAQENGPPY